MGSKETISLHPQQGLSVTAWSGWAYPGTKRKQLWRKDAARGDRATRLLWSPRGVITSELSNGLCCW